MTKVCTKCGVEKDEGEYYVNKKDGYSFGRCKQCCKRPKKERYKATKDEKQIKMKEATARYREKNKEKIREYRIKYTSTPEYKEYHRQKAAEWRKNNPEKTLEISRKCYKKNGEKQNEKKREKFKTDPEYKQKVRERELKYVASGRRREMSQKNYHENRERALRTAKEWKNKNTDRCRENHRRYAHEKWNAHEKELRQKLDDSYIIDRIKDTTKYTLKTEEIPESLIELKRQAMKLKRELKKINNDKD